MKVSNITLSIKVKIKLTMGCNMYRVECQFNTLYFKSLSWHDRMVICIMSSAFLNCLYWYLVNFDLTARQNLMSLINNYGRNMPLIFNFRFINLCILHYQFILQLCVPGNFFFLRVITASIYHIQCCSDVTKPLTYFKNL